MEKYAILKEIFEIDGINDRIIDCPKITAEQLLHILSKPSYSLKIELGLSAGTVSKYLKKLFPDRPTTTARVCNYLLYKYGYKQCKSCEEVLEIDGFHRNAATCDKHNSYCKRCQIALTSDTAAYRVSKYRSAKLQRTPNWLTSSDLLFISEFYRNCPDGYVVDHIIPLQGELVSGLHVPANLQYLTVAENCSKRNKFLPL